MALAHGNWLPHFSSVENDLLCPSEQRVDKWHLMSLPAPIHLDGRLQTTTLCLIFCTLGAFFSDFFKALLIFVPPSHGPQNVYSVIWRRKCFPAILFNCCLKELIEGSITSQDWLQAMALQVKDWHWLIPWQETCQNQLPFPVYKAILLSLYFDLAGGLVRPWGQKARQFCLSSQAFLLPCVLEEWHLHILNLRAMVLGLLIWQAEGDSREQTCRGEVGQIPVSGALQKTPVLSQRAEDRPAPLSVCTSRVTKRFWMLGITQGLCFLLLQYLSHCHSRVWNLM